jgi:tetratricopeptide (TPR) repeat protein
MSRIVWVAAAIGAIVVGSVLGVMVGRRDESPTRDPRVEKAFVLAQRGENDKALQLLADYLATHKQDADAQTIAFLATWWQGTQLDEMKKKLVELPLRPAQRAMVNGVELITLRRDPEAIAYLTGADRETPNSVEILYALGEAQWHGQHLEEGVATLERAFSLDPRWQMALHHVLEYRLSRGETDALQPIVERLRTTDSANAAALDCKIAISRRDYPGAIVTAKTALADGTIEKIGELYLCLAQAQALVGDLDGGATNAKIAFDLWPLEAHDKGGFAQHAEFFLYRNDLDGYLELTRGRQSSQRALAILMRRPELPVNAPQPEWPKSRMAPLGAATWMLQQHVHEIDAQTVIATYPEPEVRAWGQALAAEANGDKGAAIAKLREALAVPAKGDIRMLVAHRLAKLLRETGDAAGAAAACEEVLRPRFYVNYRAILLPDCAK